MAAEKTYMGMQLTEYHICVCVWVKKKVIYMLISEM